MKEISKEQQEEIIQFLDSNISDTEEIEDIEHGEDNELIITTRQSECVVVKYSLKIDFLGCYD